MILGTQTEAIIRWSFGREYLDLYDVEIHGRIGQNISMNNDSVSFTLYTVNLVYVLFLLSFIPYVFAAV